MKRISLPLLLITITTMAFVTTTPSSWQLDTAHSNLRFSVTNLLISEIEGTFKMTESTITAQKEDFSDAVVSMVADINSVDTDNDARDAHLRTADFFDAVKYPTMTFSSTSFEKLSDKKYKVTGNLTLHGVTKQVMLEAIANFGTHPMSKKTIAGFKITGSIKRTDFGIAPSTPSAMISDEVYVVANAQFAKN